MAGLLKKTTNLTGLAVAVDAKKTLTVLYDKILRTIQKMPDDATYRQSTEQIVKERLGVVNATKDVNEMEKKINCGQAEELILQAERELDLARKFLEWRPWEPLKEKAPEGQWKWPHP